MIHSPARFSQWLPALFDGEFSWDFLDPAWMGTKIKPMDFDAVIERHGHRLIFETKAPNTPLQIGQVITLTNEWKLGATIFHLEGKTPETIEKMAVYPEGGYEDRRKFGCIPLKSCGWPDVLFRARRWFCWASGSPIPTREEWDTQLWVWDTERKNPSSKDDIF